MNYVNEAVCDDAAHSSNVFIARNCMAAWLFQETPSLPIVEVGSTFKVDISSKIDRNSTSSFSRRLDLNTGHVRYDVQAVDWPKNRTKNECRER
jgi:hypothetical protein